MTIEPNKVTALIGSSGCGKTTFLRSLNRMHELTPGPGSRARSARRRGHLRLGRRPGPGPPPDRDGLPGAEPVPDDVDLRERRRRPQPQRRPDQQGREGRGRRALAARRPPLGRGQGPARQAGLRPLRRPAAAALHRPRDRGRARGAADGRALLGARPGRDAGDRGPDPRAEERATRSRSSPTTCSRPRGPATSPPSSTSRSRASPGRLVEIGRDRDDLHQTRPSRRPRTTSAAASAEPGPNDARIGRVEYQEELDNLEASALGGLDLVSAALARTLEAIEHQDIELAQIVVADDDRIDGRYLEVHQA